MGSILIVARNSLALTKLAVKSALAQDVPCDVLVIDNDSADGTSYWLRTKPLAYIAYHPQKSLSACWNAGIKAFWSVGASEVLVINNDVEIAPNTYRILSAGEGFTTGVGVSDREQFKPVPGILLGTSRPHPDFSCFMIRKEVTDKVGWFDESYYPAYCEDSDYHVRMHKAGIEAVCVDLPFYHYAAGTLKNANPAEASAIKHGADANRERFRKQYGCLPGSDAYNKLFEE